MRKFVVGLISLITIISLIAAAWQAGVHSVSRGYDSEEFKIALAALIVTSVILVALNIVAVKARKRELKAERGKPTELQNTLRPGEMVRVTALSESGHHAILQNHSGSRLIRFKEPVTGSLVTGKHYMFSDDNSLIDIIKNKIPEVVSSEN